MTQEQPAGPGNTQIGWKKTQTIIVQGCPVRIQLAPRSRAACFPNSGQGATNPSDGVRPLGLRPSRGFPLLSGERPPRPRKAGPVFVTSRGPCSPDSSSLSSPTPQSYAPSTCSRLMCRLTRLWDDSRSTGSLGDEGGAAGLVAEEPNQGSSSAVPIVCVPVGAV